jgi:DNA-binding PadR family transcriptional regulator
VKAMLTIRPQDGNCKPARASGGSDDLETRVVKSFADIIILKFFKHHPQSSGYQVLRHMHNEFGMVFSPGTIYQEIYRLERKKCLEGATEGNGRIYTLTGKGEKALTYAAKYSKQVNRLIVDILSMPNST